MHSYHAFPENIDPGKSGGWASSFIIIQGGGYNDSDQEEQLPALPDHCLHGVSNHVFRCGIGGKRHIITVAVVSAYTAWLKKLNGPFTA